MDQEQESPKVKVSDRRRFSADGEPLEETETEPVKQASEGSSSEDETTAPEPPPPESSEADATAGESSTGASPPPESAGAETAPESPKAHTASGESSAAAPFPPESAETDTTASARQGTPPLPPASFETLVLSLGMQAQFELGFGGQPDQEPPNLDVARHSIDMLGVLKEKTKGNLSMSEDRLLENTLTELRFRYVQVVGEINKQAKA